MERINRLLFRNEFDNIVYPAMPFRFNERIIAQQGAFLCPSSIERPFIEILLRLLGRKHRKIIRHTELCFTFEQAKEAIIDLEKMSITQATLFPGIGGFAESSGNQWFLTQYPKKPIPKEKYF